LTQTSLSPSLTAAILPPKYFPMTPYRVEPQVEVTAQLAVEEENPELGLPRILCLHGGGTNARIFRAQCCALINQLRHEFRLVFAQAPFNSEAGPDVLSVYSEWDHSAAGFAGTPSTASFAPKTPAARWTGASTMPCGRIMRPAPQVTG
jgi:hypothetical protein